MCSCNVLCPCWIGEDPDGGECTSVVAYHIDSGQITGRGGQRGVRPIGLGLIVLGLLMLAAPSAAAGG